MKGRFSNYIWGVVLLVISILIAISLISYDPNDLSRPAALCNTSSPNLRIANWAGIIGAYLSGSLIFIIGLSAYIIPALTLIWAIGRFLERPIGNLYTKLASTMVLLLTASCLSSLVSIFQPIARVRGGGVIGLYFSEQLIKYFGSVGAYVILISLLVFSLLPATEFLILPFGLWLGKFTLISIRNLKGRIIFKVLPRTAPRMRREKIPAAATKAGERQRSYRLVTAKAPEVKETVKPKTVPLQAVEEGAVDYKLPPLDLLNFPPPIEKRRIRDDLELNSGILEGTLRDFGIEARVVKVERGPVITRYELQPASGVKVHRITELSDDIALAMKAHSVRIVAPIPGKGTIGVEVPNSETSLVYLKEVLESDEFKTSPSKLTLALGKDISGVPIVADLAEMPHLLIAGATGSGKTVCVNSLITSILFQVSPDEVRFLMVDPKMVELAIFNGLPHLICPVVTEPKKVTSALNWAVNEMEDRYRLFAKQGVRNIEAYNEKAITPKLPYILIIIDELADLMAVASVDIENAITRLAQLSRAVGIHIVLATQRPSVDVITGVIKANFPTRISFQVASKVDSRTVLDMNGADKLLGRGDMLFLKPGTSKPIRAQGSLIQDEEIERIVNFVKSQRGPIYNEEILKEADKGQRGFDLKRDELFDEAVRVVLETGQASVSILQRRLRLGYTRAARLIDMMEAEGVVGPYRGSRPREILIDKETDTSLDPNVK